jgi:hypothetical protein
MGFMGQPKRFLDDLAYSLESRDEHFWDTAYRTAFPNMRAWELVDDLEEQRRGIDRRLLLENGTTLLIDEKKRRGTWQDILLEYISSDTPFRSGWIEKDNAIDFVAYAFMDTHKVYFFSWQFLRRAWELRKDVWLGWGKDRRNGFSIVSSKNKTYTTHSLAIPIKSLYAAVTTAMEVEVKS